MGVIKIGWFGQVGKRSHPVISAKLFGTLPWFVHWDIAVSPSVFHQTSRHIVLIWPMGIRCLTQCLFTKLYFLHCPALTTGMKTHVSSIVFHQTNWHTILIGPLGCIYYIGYLSHPVFSTKLVGTLSWFGQWKIDVKPSVFHQTRWHTVLIWPLRLW